MADAVSMKQPVVMVGAFLEDSFAMAKTTAVTTVMNLAEVRWREVRIVSKHRFSLSLAAGAGGK